MNELPPLTRLIMVAEAIDGHAAIAARSGQMEDLEAEATVLREVYRDLTAEIDRLRAIETRLLPLTHGDERPEAAAEDCAIAVAARYALHGPRGAS